METKLRKVLISLIIFMIMFSNFGFTIEAIASSEEFQVISNGFFRKDEIKFTSYFEDSGGKQNTENISNVNEKVKLKVNITPQVEGYLKNATLKAVPTSGDELNFRFVSVNYEQNESFEVKNDTSLDTIGTENLEEKLNKSENNVSDEVKNETTNEVANNIANETSENVVNDVKENTVSNETSSLNTVENEIIEEDLSDTLINEDEFVIEDEEEPTEELISDVRVISENEIELKNILEDTTLDVVIEFNKDFEINISDLYKEISLRLTGTYINRDLKEIDVAKEQILNIGWKYSKDIELSSEYTKFSPFKIGDVTGIIAENKIVVARNTSEEKYLPIASTKLEIKVPTFNGKKPSSVNIQANKLMATKGQDTGFVDFTNDNWSYNSDEGKITINVENRNNDKAINSLGEDEYVIIYRFDEYTDAETVTLPKDVTITVEEYSANENNILTKTLSETEEIPSVSGELITYSIGSSEDKVNKGKIYANYNSEDIPYESEYTSNIRLNILTSDMLEELKIDGLEEYFIDKNNVAIKATGIRYKKIRFNYNDIKATLDKGGSIEIYSTSGELLYTLNKDLVKSEEDCTINMNNEPGVVINVKDVSANGKIDIEMTKAIGRPDIEKSIFASFKKIESRVTAKVKYANIDEEITLPTIGTTKAFEESYTRAEIKMNKDILTSMQENEDVEFKIELNNNLENSDLYVNPTFEIVYPKYIKEVTIESINVLYENELRVKSFETHKDEAEGVLKTKIELEGTQTRFIENSMTNGTNIILNTRIKLDEYTPRKEDQIKLYYCNEGVSNYQTQTTWKVSKNIPTNIIKQTNGFDATVINYQTPVGLIAINGILNYDGQGSELRTVKQGDKTERIAMNKPAVNSTMELVVLNNTGNECTDITMLGRVPFKGNKDVISNKDLGTNIDVTLKGLVQEDTENSAKATIYYSSKEDANKNLSDESNAWTTEVEDFSKVKSFLIVVDGKVEPGAFLRYTYNFEIPENLPYEAKIVGSFGAYYNNITDVAVVYESSSADKVILETEAGPKIEATMNVDIGNGADVLEARFLKYTITVRNTGSIDAENVKIINPTPLNTRICARASLQDNSDNGYSETNSKEKVWEVGKIKAGEIVEKELLVRTSPSIENNEEVYIENYAIVSIPNLAKEITTNTVKNRLVNANFDIKTAAYQMMEQLNVGDSFEYSAIITNISGKEMKNVVLEDVLPKELSFSNIRFTTKEYEYENDTETNTLSINLGDMPEKESTHFYIECKIDNMKNVGQGNIENQIVLKSDGNVDEKGCKVISNIIGPELEVSQTSSLGNENALEAEEFDVIVNMKNNGEGNSNKLNLKISIPEELTIRRINSEGRAQIKHEINSNIISAEINSISSSETSSLIITVRPKTLKDGNEKNVTIYTEMKEEIIGSLEVNNIDIRIEKNPNKPITDEDIEEENKDNTIDNPTADDSYLNDKPIDNNNNNSNNDNSNNNNNDNSNNNNVNNQKPDENKKKSKITGQIWLDKNKDGRKDDDETRISGIKVQLEKDGKMIKACTSDSTGTYRFENLEAGKYNLIFAYDSEKYVATTYRKSGIEEDRNSDAPENAEGTAITNTITVIDVDITNIDLGLKEKEKFDIAIHKYLSKATVIKDKKERTYEFEDKEIAQLSIKAKELKDTNIKLEYKIVVENIGDVAGSVEKILDYLPKDVTFDEKENKGWYLGKDGVLYNESLKNTEIDAGEKKELRIILRKEMTPDNTGVVVNKVELNTPVAKQGLNEEKDGNVATQETIITVSTGGAVQSIISITIIIIAIVIIISFKNNKISISNISFNFNKKYKNKEKEKKKIKKIYK